MRAACFFAVLQSLFPHNVRSKILAYPSIQGQRPWLGARASARAGPLLNLSIYICIYIYIYIFIYTHQGQGWGWGHS